MNNKSSVTGFQELNWCAFLPAVLTDAKYLKWTMHCQENNWQDSTSDISQKQQVRFLSIFSPLWNYSNYSQGQNNWSRSISLTKMCKINFYSNARSSAVRENLNLLLEILFCNNSKRHKIIWNGSHMQQSFLPGIFLGISYSVLEVWPAKCCNWKFGSGTNLLNTAMDCSRRSGFVMQ